MKNKKLINMKNEMKCMRNVVFALVILLLLAPLVNAAGSNNVSILYGWNGTSFVPVNVADDGSLMTTINMTSSIGVSPALNNTYDLGSLALLWANLYTRTIRSSGLLSVIGDTSITGTLYADSIVANLENSTGLTNASLNYVWNGTQWLGAKATSTGIMQLDITNLAADQLGSTATGGLLTLANGLNVTAGGLTVAAGNVGIGTTTPGQLLDVNGAIRSGQSNGIQFTRSSNWFTISDAGGYSNLAWFSSYNGTNWTASHAVVKPSKIYGDDNGLHFQASATLGVGSAINDFSDKLTILNGGNVGIGTTAPLTNLQVSDASDLTSIGFGLTPYPAWLAAKISLAGVASYGADLVFSTHPANSGNNASVVEGFRLKQNGNVGIGTTSPDYKLDVAGTVRVGDGVDPAILYFYDTSVSVSRTNIGQGTDGLVLNGLYRVTVSTLGTGAVQATSGVLSVTSDERLKNILPGPYPYGLNEVRGLVAAKNGIIRYNWNAESHLPTDVLRAGMGAQTAHEFIPESAFQSADGTWGFDERPWLGAALVAINTLDTYQQDHNKRITELETENSQLKNKNNQLEARIASLEAKIK